MLKGKQVMIYETDPQFFENVFVEVEDTFKCMICKFNHKLKSIIILAGI